MDWIIIYIGLHSEKRETDINNSKGVHCLLLNGSDDSGFCSAGNYI